LGFINPGSVLRVKQWLLLPLRLSKLLSVTSHPLLLPLRLLRLLLLLLLPLRLLRLLPLVLPLVR
jgi:hypothetical protein